MVTKVKVNGFENTNENNEVLRKVVKILFPLTPNKEDIEVGVEFQIVPFSNKTKEEYEKDIENLMKSYLNKPF